MRSGTSTRDEAAIPDVPSRSHVAFHRPLP
jgi:hypothetical protein